MYLEKKSIVIIVWHYLRLIKLQLEHKLSTIGNIIAWFSTALDIIQFAGQFNLTIN